MVLREEEEVVEAGQPSGDGRESPASAVEQPAQTKILVVDDERNIRELLADILAEKGYEVATASTGSKALEEIRAPGEKFDIVITDLKMPGANGIEVLREARAMNPESAVIIMTAFATVESAVECMKAGAFDYITKPMKLDELRLIVERAAERLFLIREAEQKRYYEELSRLDGMTRLFNHSYFQHLLSAEMEHARRFSRVLSLLMIDIDDFKRVNDAYGHQVGDHVLKTFAELLTTLTRQTDFAARYGGEEFAVLLTVTSRDMVATIAERIRKTVEARPFQPDGFGQEIHLTASIGVAGFPQDASDGRELLSKADAALYAAKAAGKNAVRRTGG